MLNIVIQKLKDQFRGIVYYLIGLIAYAWLMIAVFPSMSRNNFDQILTNYPQEFLKFFGGENTSMFSTIEGFLSMEYLSLFFVLIIIFYVGSAAGSAMAGAIEKHQMDFNLSQPISRTKLLLGEASVSVLYLITLVAITVVSMWGLGQAYNVNLNAKGLLAFGIVVTIFLLALYGIAIFCSSFMKSKMAVTGTIAGVTIGLYMLYSLGNVVDKLDKFQKYSLFNLYNPQDLLTTGVINWHQVEILAAIFLAGLIGSLIIFNKRDI